MSLNPIDIVSSIVTLVEVIKTLDDLHSKYQNAPDDLMKMSAECASTKTVVQAVQVVLAECPAQVISDATGKMLVGCFTQTVASIESLLGDFAKEVKRLDKKQKSKLGLWEKTKFVWRQDYFEGTLQDIQKHKNDLHFVLQVVQFRVINGWSAQSHPPGFGVPGASPLALKLQSGSTTSNPQLAVPGKGQGAKMKTLAHSKSDTNIKKTPAMLGDELLAAVMASKAVAVAAALDAGADPNRPLNHARDRALHIAARNGSLPVVDVLLAHGADVSLQNAAKETALHQALEAGQQTTPLVLISNGAPLEARNAQGRTPLILACRRNLKLPAQCLLDRGADVAARDLQGLTPLEAVITSRDREGKPLKPDLRVLRLVLGSGADPNASKHIKATASAPPWERPLLWLAHQLGHVDIAAALLEHGAAVDAPRHAGETLLHIVARKGSAEWTRLLLKHKAPVDRASNRGWTPLHEAADAGKVVTARLLLEGGAAVDASNVLQETPFMSAASAGRLAVMRLLVAHKTKWWHLTGRRSNAFLRSCENGHVHCASYLLGLGNNLDKRAHGDFTGLHYAAVRGRTEMVRFLLELGVDRTVKATEKRYPFQVAGTAAEVARAHGHAEVAELIEGWVSETDDAGVEK